jgi:hypothetical protein
MYMEDLLDLNYGHVVIVAIIGFALGALWYSRLLFANRWMAEMKMSAESMQGSGGAGRMTGAFILTLLSTAVLAALVADHHSHGAIHGAELGALLGVGLVAARQGVSAVFDRKPVALFLIVAGHDVVLCIVQGAILAAWH